MPSRNRRRSYDNTLRLEHAQQTRERILESAVQVIANAGKGGASLAQVARAARVSEPTLYRHFGSRERLLEELDAHAQAKMGFPVLPSSSADLPRHVATLFEKFHEHAPLIRAANQSGVRREMRAHARTKRTRVLRELVSASAPDLTQREVARVTSVLRVLASWEAFETMTGEMGMSAEDASDAVRWALDALFAGVTKEKRAKRVAATSVAAKSRRGTRSEENDK
jgi:AcrR family transcriptional regulator